MRLTNISDFESIFVLSHPMCLTFMSITHDTFCFRNFKFYAHMHLWIMHLHINKMDNSPKYSLFGSSTCCLGYIYIDKSGNICVWNYKFYTHLHVYTFWIHISNMGNISSTIKLESIFCVYLAHLYQTLSKYLSLKLQILHTCASMYNASAH